MSQSVYNRITETLLEMLRNNPGPWTRPWRVAGACGFPINAVSRKAYRGTNVILLWAVAQERGYSGNQWATYRQWASLGAQVRKGERGSPVSFFTRRDTSESATETEPDEAGLTSKRPYFARCFSVFHVDQVQGYDVHEQPDIAAAFEPDIATDRFINATGAHIEHGGNRACYYPSGDLICMPNRDRFNSAHDYYSTLLHELTHWTAHSSRLDRDLSGRFGTAQYAAEELIAELGAAFLGSALKIEDTPREDHAQYLASWIKLLESDPKAIFTAASAAQSATDFLLDLGQVKQQRAA